MPLCFFAFFFYNPCFCILHLFNAHINITIHRNSLRREQGVRALLSELVRVALLCHYPLALEGLLAGATASLLGEDDDKKVRTSYKRLMEI